MKFYLVLIASLWLTLGACTREKTPEPDCTKEAAGQNNSWKVHPDFTLNNKCMYNSLATGDSLFLYGPAVIAQLDTNHQVQTFSANWYYSFLKQPINKDFFVEVSKPSQGIALKVTKSPVWSGSQWTPRFPVVDTSFRRLAIDWIGNLDEVVAINDQNQLLIPAYTRDAGMYERLAFYLIGVRLNSEETSYARVESTSFKKFFLNGPEYVNNGVLAIKSYYGKFFVCGDETTFLVRPDGTYKNVINTRAEKFFLHNNSLYAIAWRQVYRSDDQGENWVQVYNLSNDFYGHTFNLDDQAFFFLDDKIVLIQIDGNGISSRELVNEGLAGNQITSVCRFKDRVYVTTLSGVFYKPYQAFLTFKPEPQ